MTRPVKVPDESHPIAVEPAGARVQVDVDGHRIAESTRVLAMSEAHYPVIYYLPSDSVVGAVLDTSDKATYCPYKGDARYVHATTPDGTTHQDLAWVYDAPYAAVSVIAGHLAFDPTRTEIRIDGVDSSSR